MAWAKSTGVKTSMIASILKDYAIYYSYILPYNCKLETQAILPGGLINDVQRKRRFEHNLSLLNTTATSIQF